MSSWLNSWLPLSLPSIDLPLPSSIQRRFISFALKRSLGHLLKPGQLDVQQINSQIGSGYVQVRDLELDNNGINSMLSGLPIVLHDGSIGKVTARMPWPNPLTSTIGLELESLHLTFCLSPTLSHGDMSSSVDLAESVTSIAESFIHEELSSGEEATLRHSLHLDSGRGDSDNLPGGFDPFISDDEGTNLDGENEPPGVSVFATLIERLLARFAFEAVDTKITIVHPQHASFTLNIPGIRYGTEGKSGESSADATGSEFKVGDMQGEVRTIAITGTNVTSCCLLPTTPTSDSLAHCPPSSLAATTAPATPDPSSPYSDSSDIDEDTQMMMSQSIAALPPRLPSPANSVASSMYQSAMSTASREDLVERPSEVMSESRSQTPLPKGRDGVGVEYASATAPQLSPRQVSGAQTGELEHDMLLSFGSEPIVLRLITPPPSINVSEAARFSTTQTNPSRTRGSEQDKRGSNDKLRISMNMGVVACSLRARHIKSILDITQFWSTHAPSAVQPRTSKASKSTTTEPRSSVLNTVEGSLQVRSMVMLLLPASTSRTHLNTSELSDFFKRPLVSPRLPHGFVRVHLDDLYGSLSLNPAPKTVSALSMRRRSSVSNPSSTTIMTTISLGEVSAFAFLLGADQSTHTPSEDPSVYAYPIAITDPQLQMQYASQHLHPTLASTDSQYPSLPTFDIVDWTDPLRRSTNAKLSLWRTKLPQHPHVHMNPSQFESRSPQPSPRRRGSDLPVSSSPTSLRSVPMGHSSPSASDLYQSPGVAIAVASDTHGRTEIDVNFAPLHVFVDLGLALARNADGTQSEVLEFLGEIEGVKDQTLQKYANVGSDDSGGNFGADEDADTPPGTPRVRVGYSLKEREQERERRRLERMVMEDLDLGIDYLQEDSKSNMTSRKQTPPLKTHKPVVNLKFPMIRVQVRTLSPKPHAQRSGALVLDVHDLRLSPGEQNSDEQSTARFADVDGLYASRSSSLPITAAHGSNTVLALTCGRVVVAYAPVSEGRACALVSLGPLATDSRRDGVQFGAGTSPNDRQVRDALARPHVQLMRTLPPASADAPAVTKTSITVDIPSLHAELSKTTLDGLQLWADDVTQLLENAFGDSSLWDLDTEAPESRNPSLIGSRYFAKDETVLTVGIIDISVKDTGNSGSTTTILGLMPLRTLVSTPRSAVKVRFISLIVPETTSKESRVKIELSGVSYTLFPDFEWATDLVNFAKAPPGAFESVVPSERTTISVKITDSAVRILAPTFPGALVPHIGELNISTVIVGDSTESSFRLEIPSVSLFLSDDLAALLEEPTAAQRNRSLSSVAGIAFWAGAGYALLAQIEDLDMRFARNADVIPPDTRMTIKQSNTRLYLCADTLTALTGFISDLSSAFQPPTEIRESTEPKIPEPVNLSATSQERSLMSSLDEDAFRQPPEIGSTPDMINDDLPTNPDYLDESFGSAAGLRELDDDEFEVDANTTSSREYEKPAHVSTYGGETIKMLRPEGLHIIEDYFLDMKPESADSSSSYGETTLRCRIHDSDVTLFLYDGYDWQRTRRIIEEQQKEMRRKLAKIRQLVASGQVPDPSVEETNTLLFNSVYIGLEHNVDELEPGALIAAIDEELNEDADTATQSSWQSLKPQGMTSPGKSGAHTRRSRRRQMRRAKNPSIEFQLRGMNVEIDQYKPEAELVARTLITVQDVEILDHIKTSTWHKFLTALSVDTRGNIRETGSNMVRVELRSIHPQPEHSSEEARLRAKILPLRLHVDQDALDFLKIFFSFKDPDSAPPKSTASSQEIYFQQAEVFPVDIKLDYKPRRVDYRALRDGRTIELMNFFHFDGAEMTLRHITLTGITGWPRFFDLLNDLWTPDVKATQLVDVISGVAPIRSVVNVGSGVADLVLLPITQYKKDGRVVRGLQKGTTAFVKSTAIEAIKLGARLATGTQVILEQAENVIGGQFSDRITAETMQVSPLSDGLEELSGEETSTEDLISRYAEQPMNVKEGVQSAYKSLRRNLNSAAQTILAVPMEVYERSGNEGPVRAVVRAVPIAVLKPMIGASEAVSKTLLGLHNSLDPNVRQENEAKYKQR
ncbi:hypothetical protein WOLCODRAFT_87760 [Wolfiporia cocos MD-104 SS10]|uniref:Autophagy-related protein 2 n=1 Tax=Wolfiporia cocos (strain MD-104) TaxID=742152 RepID=A0A2H3J702_WOLCO|nr:hypothetical protein WOLCODRAFT_87760 [Wolfiporia cocos MD-104 SS10]